MFRAVLALVVLLPVLIFLASRNDPAPTRLDDAVTEGEAGARRLPERNGRDSDPVPVPSPSAPGSAERPVATDRETALLAEGRVLDEFDRPVAGVLLRVLAPGAEHPEWPSLHPQAARSDREGRFLLRGSPRARFDLAVEPLDEGLVPLRLHDILPGTRRLLVRLNHTAALVGRVELPPGIAGSWLNLVVLDETDDRVKGRAAADDDGRFVIEGLMPGPSRLLVLLLGSAAPLAEIPDIHLDAGLACRDPRLDPIPLADFLPTCRLEVVDQLGLPVAGARVIGLARAESRGGPVFACALTDEEGVITLPRIPGGLSVEISHDDYALMALEGVEDSRCVVLHEAPLVTLLLPAPDLELPFGLGLELRFRYGEKRRLGRDDLLASRVPDRIVLIPRLPAALDLALSAPGDYEIIMSLVTREGRRDAEPIASLFMRLDPDDGQRRLPLASRRAEFQRALERLEARRARER